MNLQQVKFISPFDRETEIASDFAVVTGLCAHRLAKKISNIADEVDSDSNVLNMAGRLRVLSGLLTGGRNSSHFGPYIYEVGDELRPQILSAGDIKRRISNAFTVETPVQSLLVGAFGLQANNNAELLELMNLQTMKTKLLEKYSEYIVNANTASLNLGSGMTQKVDEMASRYTQAYTFTPLFSNLRAQ